LSATIEDVDSPAKLGHDDGVLSLRQLKRLPFRNACRRAAGEVHDSPPTSSPNQPARTHSLRKN
jgi:hypothetical protein